MSSPTSVYGAISNPTTSDGLKARRRSDAPSLMTVDTDFDNGDSKEPDEEESDFSPRSRTNTAPPSAPPSAPVTSTHGSHSSGSSDEKALLLSNDAEHLRLSSESVAEKLDVPSTVEKMRPDRSPLRRFAPKGLPDDQKPHLLDLPSVETAAATRTSVLSSLEEADEADEETLKSPSPETISGGSNGRSYTFSARAQQEKPTLLGIPRNLSVTDDDPDEPPPNTRTHRSSVTSLGSGRLGGLDRETATQHTQPSPTTSLRGFPGLALNSRDNLTLTLPSPTAGRASNQRGLAQPPTRQLLAVLPLDRRMSTQSLGLQLSPGSQQLSMDSTALATPTVICGDRRGGSNANAREWPSEIIPGFLFLGGQRAANSQQQMEERQITRYLCCAVDAPLPNHVNTDRLRSGEVVVKHIKMRDGATTQLEQHFSEAFQFLRQAKKEKQRVFVYCKEGKSRSASIVIAYFIRYYKLTYEAAFSAVRQRRSAVDPNFAFCNQLGQYDTRTQDYFAEQGSNATPTSVWLCPTPTHTGNNGASGNANKRLTQHRVSVASSLASTFLSSGPLQPPAFANANASSGASYLQSQELEGDGGGSSSGGTAGSSPTSLFLLRESAVGENGPWTARSGSPELSGSPTLAGPPSFPFFPSDGLSPVFSNRQQPFQHHGHTLDTREANSSGVDTPSEMSTLVTPAPIASPHANRIAVLRDLALYNRRVSVTGSTATAGSAAQSVGGLESPNLTPADRSITSTPPRSQNGGHAATAKHTFSGTPPRGGSSAVTDGIVPEREHSEEEQSYLLCSTDQPPTSFLSPGTMQHLAQSCHVPGEDDNDDESDDDCDGEIIF